MASILALDVGVFGPIPSLRRSSSGGVMLRLAARMLRALFSVEAR